MTTGWRRKTMSKILSRKCEVRPESNVDYGDSQRRVEEIFGNLRQIVASCEKLTDSLIEIHVEGHGKWTVEIEAGKGTVSNTGMEGRTPTSSLKTDARTFLAMASRQVKPLTALLRGKISVRGDFASLMALSDKISEAGHVSSGVDTDLNIQSSNTTQKKRITSFMKVLGGKKESTCSSCGKVEKTKRRISSSFRRSSETRCCSCKGYSSEERGNSIKPTMSSSPDGFSSEGFIVGEQMSKEPLQHVQSIHTEAVTANLNCSNQKLVQKTANLLQRLRAYESRNSELESSTMLESLKWFVVTKLNLLVLTLFMTLSWNQVADTLRFSEGHDRTSFWTILSLGMILRFSHRYGIIAFSFLTSAVFLFYSQPFHTFEALLRPYLLPYEWLVLLFQCQWYRPFFSLFIFGIAIVGSVISRYSSRFVRMYSTSISIALVYAVANRFVTKIVSSSSKVDRIFHQLDEFFAPILFAEILDLKSVFVKFAQYVGSRPHTVNPEWARVLAKLQDEMPTDDPKYVETSIQRAFGRPIGELFTSFDLQPIASASVAQVHRAVLRANICQPGATKGEDIEVAVKIQHEGIADQMRKDALELRRIVNVVVWLIPDLSFAVDIFNHWHEQLENELDFQIEANYLTIARSNLRKVSLVADGDFDYSDTNYTGSMVVVPRPIYPFVAKDVFCMSFVHGFKISDVEQLDLYGVDRTALMKRILQSFGSQLLLDGFLNVDPHPGNLMVNVSCNGTARPVLLDFGMITSFDKPTTLSFCNLINNQYMLSSVNLKQSVLEIGLVLNGEEDNLPLSLLEFFGFFFRESGNVEFEKKCIAAFEKSKLERVHERKTSKTMFSEIPDSVLFFIRAVSLLRGVSSVLEVKVDFLEVLVDYARLGLLCNNIDQASYPRNTCNPEFRSATELQVAVQDILQKYSSSTKQSPLVSNVRDLSDVNSFVGAQVCCVHRGVQTVSAANGVLNELSPFVASTASLFPLFDLSRVLPLLALFELEKKGAFKVTDRVCDHWPNFYNKSATIQEVLNYSEKLTDLLGTKSFAESFTNRNEVIAKLESELPEQSETPTDKASYQIFTFGYVVSQLLEVLCNKVGTKVQSEEIISELGVQHSEEMSLSLANTTKEDRKSIVADAVNCFVPMMKKLGISSGMKDVEKNRNINWDSFYDPSCVNADSFRAEYIPSFGAFSSARYLTEMVSRAFFKSNSQAFSDRFFTSSKCVEENPFLGYREFALGFQVHFVGPKKVKVLSQQAFGGSVLLIVPEEELVVTVLVNGLTIDRSFTKEVVTMILEGHGVSICSKDLFSDSF